MYGCFLLEVCSGDNHCRAHAWGDDEYSITTSSFLRHNTCKFVSHQDTHASDNLQLIKKINKYCIIHIGMTKVKNIWTFFLLYLKYYYTVSRSDGSNNRYSLASILGKLYLHFLTKSVHSRANSEWYILSIAGHFLDVEIFYIRDLQSIIVLYYLLSRHI